MRKIINLFCASLFLLVGCTEDVALEVNPISDPFYALVEGTTRTYADENGKLLWTANDKISIFKGNTLPLVYQFTGFTGATYGGFKDVTPLLGDFVTSADLPANYAIYPYVESTTISNSSVIHYTIPSTQAYAENSFGLGANVMVAVTENKDDRNLAFKNVGGYFEFSLYGEGVTVKRIVFSGNNSEKLAGDVTITATHDGTPTVAFADDATTSLTLDCGEGVELGADEEHATKFWFVVPAMTYTKGITLTITDTYGRIMKKTTSKSITIERSTVQPLSTFDAAGTEYVIPDNQIWYKSTNGKIVTPYSTDKFGANIISNVYENGQGIITFDDNVTSIGVNAFYKRSSLERITIPNSVTSIGYNAFAGCSSLESITLPDSVTSIGSSAFSYCSSLESITIPDGVTEIGDAAFYNCDALDSITLPDSVISIGGSAFQDCSSLERVTLPDGVTTIETNTFLFCTSLESITLPDSVTSIGYSAFGYCSSLTSITLPDSVTSIRDSAFGYCSSLTSITLPDGVTSIGDSAFRSCSSLTSITLPDGVTSIGDFAFSNCSSLESINIPDGVTGIGALTFSSCSSLQTITIPDSVTMIGDGAFSECSSLINIYCECTKPPCLSGSAFECHESVLNTIYVPAESVDVYKAADGWSNYASIIEGYTF